jgi:hypothetical protein
MLFTCAAVAACPQAWRMSMIGNFCLISDAQLSSLLARPNDVVDVIDAADETGDDALCIEKDSHGLHFLFTETAWHGDEPLNFVVSGGDNIGDVDVGYGPARGFTAQQVCAIVDALEKVSNDDLRARFNGKEMDGQEIYLRFGNATIYRGLDMLMQSLSSLRILLKRAVELKCGALTWLN